MHRSRWVRVRMGSVEPLGYWRVLADIVGSDEDEV